MSVKGTWSWVGPCGPYKGLYLGFCQSGVPNLRHQPYPQGKAMGVGVCKWVSWLVVYRRAWKQCWRWEWGAGGADGDCQMGSWESAGAGRWLELGCQGLLRRAWLERGRAGSSHIWETPGLGPTVWWGRKQLLRALWPWILRAWRQQRTSRQMAFWGQEASASTPTGTEGPLPEADYTLSEQCPMASSPQPPTHPTKITAMRLGACRSAF